MKLAKKIHSVTLKELEVIEIDGEFREVYKNEKRYPLFLTNHALRRGRDLGLIESSMMSDVLNMEKGFKGKQQEEAARETIADLSEEKMQNVIYLAFLGANPRTEYSIDTFLERYHNDYIETLTLYMEIISSSISSGDNKFSAGLKKATKKPSSKEKK
jgi:hypothetical protein